MSKSKTYLGFIWFILSLLCSSFNDVMTRILLADFYPMQIACFRFLFGSLSLMPFILCNHKSIKTKYPLMQFIRGTVLAIAIVSWITGINSTSLAVVTLLGFSIPIFTLLLARMFLHERITLRILLATFFGFFGVIIALNPTGLYFNKKSILLLLSTFCFASLDIMNKKFVTKEKLLPMLFYSSFIAFLWFIFPTYQHWHTIYTIKHFILFIILGIMSNCLLYCLLKAFTYNPASALVPLRYLEILFTAIAAYLMFNELPDANFYIGLIIIVPATSILLYNKPNN